MVQMDLTDSEKRMRYSFIRENARSECDSLRNAKLLNIQRYLWVFRRIRGSYTLRVCAFRSVERPSHQQRALRLHIQLSETAEHGMGASNNVAARSTASDSANHHLPQARWNDSKLSGSRSWGNVQVTRSYFVNARSREVRVALLILLVPWQIRQNFRSGHERREKLAPRRLLRIRILVLTTVEISTSLRFQRLSSSFRLSL